MTSKIPQNLYTTLLEYGFLLQSIDKGLAFQKSILTFKYATSEKRITKKVCVYVQIHKFLQSAMFMRFIDMLRIKVANDPKCTFKSSRKKLRYLQLCSKIKERSLLMV